MKTVRRFNYSGWLPAGLVVNSTVVTEKSTGATPLLSSWGGGSAVIAQASDDQAIRLNGKFLTSVLMIPLSAALDEVPRQSRLSLPFMLAAPALYQGEVEIIGGDGVPSTQILITGEQGWESEDYQLGVMDVAIIVPVDPVTMFQAKESMATFFQGGRGYDAAYRGKDDTKEYVIQKVFIPWRGVWPTTHLTRTGSDTRDISGPVFRIPGQDQNLMLDLGFQQPYGATNAWLTGAFTVSGGELTWSLGNKVADFTGNTFVGLFPMPLSDVITSF